MYFTHFISMLVAKKKSLFDDRPMEIQELTYIIKQVQSICFQLRSEKYCNFQNTFFSSTVHNFLEKVAH